ncbi:MAG: fibrobacter succinogenes major paralogous domain-containing protein [Bacteroidales bacterium]|nr:fibrobacter succinogenes major paralogous domain-containing protein [Bacteroidales bacterium]
MKRKINILISAVLILLILPMQFGCNKDKLMQDIEKQADADEQAIVGVPPTLPDGTTPEVSNDLKSTGGATIGNVKLWDGRTVTIDKTLDSWDTKCRHAVGVNFTNDGSYTIKVYHYYYRGGWVCKVKTHNTGYQQGGTYTCNNIWNVSFQKDDHLITYAYVYVNGTYIGGKWGNQYTIADPTPTSWGEKLMVEAAKYLGVAFIKGLSIPWTTVVKWALPYFSNQMVIINVVDQYGNPLHANVTSAFGTKATNLGSVQITDMEIMSLGKNITVTCKEPDGPQSYDNNLMDRQKTFNVSEYFNDMYWGKSGGNIPVVTVVFNTNGTTTVDFPEKIECIDGSGHSYKTVQIGDQWWMAENLNYNVSGSYCYNNNPHNGPIYGRLYTWDAAKAAVPDGWHLPTNAEWNTLQSYLGGGSVAGGKMKETGTVHWKSPNIGATNESGFTVLPCGYYSNSTGRFYSLGNHTYFWSATEYNSSYAWVRYLDYRYSDVLTSNTLKVSGFSVRCIKN